MKFQNPPEISESAQQSRFVKWFRESYQGVLIHSIPNGGKRKKVTAAIMKREGAHKGMPDLHVPAWDLWLEFKKEDGGKTSKAQDAVIAYLRENGDTVYVPEGLDDAMRFTLNFVEEIRDTPKFQHHIPLVMPKEKE